MPTLAHANTDFKQLLNGEFYQLLKFGLNPRMDLPAHRRQQLLRLIETRYEGNKKAFCQEAEISDSRLSQLLSTTYRKGGEFGERVARAIEQRLGLPALFFEPHLYGASDGAPGNYDLVSVPKGDLLQVIQIFMDADDRGRWRIMQTAAQVAEDMSRGASLGTSSRDKL